MGTATPRTRCPGWPGGPRRWPQRGGSGSAAVAGAVDALARGGRGAVSAVRRAASEAACRRRCPDGGVPWEPASPARVPRPGHTALAGRPLREGSVPPPSPSAALGRGDGDADTRSCPCPLPAAKPPEDAAAPATAAAARGTRRPRTGNAAGRGARRDPSAGTAGLPRGPSGDSAGGATPGGCWSVGLGAAEPPRCPRCGCAQGAPRKGILGLKANGGSVARAKSHRYRCTALHRTALH